MATKILIARDFHPSTADPVTATVASVGQLRTAGWRSFLASHVLRYHEAGALVRSLDGNHLSLKTSLALRLLSRGDAYYQDPAGRRLRVTWSLFGRLAWRWLRDRLTTRRLLRGTLAEVARLEERIAAERQRGRAMHAPSPDDSPLYLRTDLVFGLQAGGSVGHIAGVLNHLGRFFGPPVFITSDPIPTVAETIPTLVVPPEERFLNSSELASLYYNRTFVESAIAQLGLLRPAFVYQRYSANDYSGLRLSRHYRCPLVLEYNGSEVWVSRHWGHARNFEAITARIEALDVAAADLVTVVSRPMRDELVAQGVSPARVLVNPNGVDERRYHPQVDAGPVRRRYRLDDAVVIGFIGTFGRWHGAEMLAEAFGRLLAEHPPYRRRLRLLLVGDGNQMPEVQARLARYQVGGQTVLTGLVPQAEGPAHLAACDLLVSPHVPNPDGSPFFGSPTKLFEYMAMGRGIVASRLDQIGELLRHDETAWLVEPGDVEALCAGIRTLVDDPDRRARLGAAARADVVENYTWLKHTERIVARLHELTGKARARAA